MRRRILCTLFVLLLLGAPITVLLVSCGGGGGGSDGTVSGTAAVFIKDAPTPEYNSIVICISKVMLEPGSVTLFESDGCVEIDLLDHQERPFLLTIKDIPAVTYSQIRLNVDYVETVGGPCDPFNITIPGGVIEATPQGSMKVKSGDMLGFEIDIHAERSVNLENGGNSQQCIFNPVALLTVANLADIPPGNECPRILDGKITEIIKAEEEVTGFKLKLSHDSKSQVHVRVDDNTAIFDEDGNFTDPEELEVKQKVKVRGEVLEDASIEASVVVIGDLLKLYGTVAEVKSKLEFIMKLSPGQVIVDEFIDVELDNQTLILKDCNTAVEPDAIKVGLGVRAIGKLSEGDLIAAVLFLEEQKTYGLIVAMDPSTGGYDLEFIPAGETDPIIIYLPEDAGVALEGDGEIDKELLADLVDCEPRKAHITLNEMDPDVADFVEVKDEVVEGIIKTTDPDMRTITLEGEPGTIIQVQEYATIIKDGELRTFDKLNSGDKIRVFGLEACPEEDVDFYGFVILVVDCPKKDDEGCSQGYWKNHLDSWDPTGYEPDDEYEDVFGVDDYDKTLLEALKSGGGGENALGRQAVAALLNAAHPHVDYYYTEDEVIDIVQDAYSTGNFENAKNRLEKRNDGSNCPLN